MSERNHDTRHTIEVAFVEDNEDNDAYNALLVIANRTPPVFIKPIHGYRGCVRKLGSNVLEATITLDATDWGEGVIQNTSPRPHTGLHPLCLLVKTREGLKYI